MKAMVCELCGSNDIVKENGFFVCQHCHTKYSLEEARKMLVEINGTVEVTGTVKVDSSEQVSNFLEMAKTAYEGKDLQGVENYCDKVLELDPLNFEALSLKARTVCWNSSLNNNKIPQAITAGVKAVQLAPDEKKTEVGETIYKEIKNTIVILLGYAKKMPLAQGMNSTHALMLNWIDAVSRLHLGDEMLEAEINDCQKMYKESKGAFMPSKRLIYGAAVGANNGEDYSVTMRKAVGK